MCLRVNGYAVGRGLSNCFSEWHVVMSVCVLCEYSPFSTHTHA